MSRRFAVVHEAQPDFEVATGLADRVLQDEFDWLEPGLLASQREWISQAPNGQPLSWTGIKELARNAGIRVHGHFGGEPGLPDAAAARRAILFLVHTLPDLSGIVLVRDQDDQPERRGGLAQARLHDKSRLPTVLGLAIVERECWLISGFEPQNDDESFTLESESRQLGRDPRMHSHALTACKNDSALRSAKRVLRSLSSGNRDRERRCWQETSLQLLRDRGGDNGLHDYLREIREYLCPLIGPIRSISATPP